MRFNGPGKKLDNIDLPTVGRLIGVGEDPIHAILDVETSGSGFDSLNRPKMLFEPHVFHRLLKGAGETSKLASAVAQDIAYPKWGALPYPRDSYSRLEKAYDLHPVFALQSASWGLGQIMGFNFALAGYKSAEAMVNEFIMDEEYQLKAMIRFVISAGLDDDLRALNKAENRVDMLIAARGFARGYNGAGFAANKYDTKIVDRLLFWRSKQDTPIS